LLSQTYRLQKRLGFGGMGAVYLTDAVRDGVRIAIKILNDDCLDEVEVVQRFAAEGAMCQHLDHPNIIKIFDVKMAENGAPYLVMEFLDGMPLSAYTANGGRIAVAQALTVVRGMLRGLQAAHQSGIVHRDLKPENVFLARDAQGSFVVKLLDFGIAKVMDVRGGMGKRTRTGALLGTPAYMSPEQIKSARDVDGRSDIFAVGVMMYEMLSGKPAFPAPTEYAKLAAVLTVEPPSLATIAQELVPLAGIVARAMAKNPEARFQTAGDMDAALASAYGAPESVSHSRLSMLPEVPALYRTAFSPGQGPHSVATSVSHAVSERPVAASGPRAPQTSALPLSAINKTPLSPIRISEISALAAQGPAVLSEHLREAYLGTLPSHDLPVLEPVLQGAPQLPAQLQQAQHAQSASHAMRPQTAGMPQQVERVSVVPPSALHARATPSHPQSPHPSMRTSSPSWTPAQASPMSPPPSQGMSSSQMPGHPGLQQNSPQRNSTPPQFNPGPSTSPAWLVVVGVIALALGFLAGFLVGRS
jgi:eukaryotic-like serine/threonine-protein kinase